MFRHESYHQAPPSPPAMLAAQQQQPVIAAATQAAPSPRKARAMKPRKPSAAATDAPVASTIDAVNDALAATSIADNVVANETENAMRPTSPEDKDKDKDVAVTMSTTDGPVSPGSAYVSMVAKRLRTLKKRLVCDGASSLFSQRDSHLCISTSVSRHARKSTRKTWRQVAPSSTRTSCWPWRRRAKSWRS